MKASLISPIRVDLTTPPSRAKLKHRTAKAILDPKWIPTIFAAKTTASGLLALLVAFTFNLDQPKWALLTVFIVAQPQSGLVLAKSFYRIVGTLIGAAGALVLVSLFAQERVLFLGALAIWIGLCTFGSTQARNFTAYGFVLSGYTVAIVGISGALDSGNAFFIAVARVTEISLGIITTAAISQLILPVSLAESLRREIATGRAELAEYATALLKGRDGTSLRTKLLGQAITIENLRASAIFEDREIRARNGALQRLNIAMLNVVDVAHLLDRSLDWLWRVGAVALPGLRRATAEAAAAIDLWRTGELDASGLRRRFSKAGVHLPLARELYGKLFTSDDAVIHGAAAVERVREFLKSFVGFVEAYETFSSRQPRSLLPVRFSILNDRVDGVWAGLRAAMALILVSTFWIITDWPSGATAAILAAVVTARLASMEHALRAAIGGTLVIMLATIPSFILVEILLPDASGFVMFALAVVPMLFCCAYMMAHKKTAGLGFVAGLYFANTAGFQDQMTYDPVGFLNASIAISLAVATAAVLFAIVAPDTPHAIRRRFVHVARRAFERIDRRRSGIGLTEFETAMAEALDQLRRGLRLDRREDMATLEAGVALMGAGREMIRIRDAGRSTLDKSDVGSEVVRFLSSRKKLPLERTCRAANAAAINCLSELRDDELSVADARVAARELVAFTAIQHELARCGELVDERTKGTPSHVA